MKEKLKTEVYSSPEAKVIELNVKKVLCQSNTERPTDVTNLDWGWTNE